MQDEAPAMEGGADDAAPAEQTTQQETQQDAPGKGDKPAEAYVPPTEAQWRQFQKEQKDTNRRYNKRHAELHAALRRGDELDARLRALETGGAAPKVSSERPNPDDPKWKSYDDYQEALLNWRDEQKERERKEADGKKGDAEGRKQKEIQWMQERAAHTQRLDEQLGKEIPDYNATFEANEDVISGMPEHILKAIFGAENGNLAVYTLLKEGRLEAIYGLSEQMAQAEIVYAQHRGMDAMKRAKATNAPAPMSRPNKGTSGAKSENEMSGRELRKRHGLV